MMEKLEHESKLEQLSDQKRRIKQQEHKRVIEHMIQERRKLKEEEHKRNVLEAESRENLSKYRREIIEQERQRLLREHAKGLVGYLPRVIIFVATTYICFVIFFI